MNTCRVCGFEGEFEISECVNTINHGENVELNQDGYGELHGASIYISIETEYFVLSTCPECRITYKMKEQPQFNTRSC